MSQQDSLESQETFFTNMIKEKGGQVVTYVDQGITGKSMARCKALKRLLKDAKMRKFDIVLIKSLSRLSRDTVDSIQTVRELRKYNVRVYSSKEGWLDDEMILTVLSSVNQRQSDPNGTC